MCENCLLSLSVHECPLAVECLDTGHKKEVFQIDNIATKYMAFTPATANKHTVSHTSAYTVWYVWQLKLLVLRQKRKLEEDEARNGRMTLWNKLRTKVSFCTSA